jgi:type IV pilus assembly protein PilB
MPKKKLGEILRERGLISADDLAKALEEQQRKVILLGEVLLERDLVSREDLVASLEEVTKVAFIDCRSATVDPEALKLVPHEVATRHGVLPIGFDGKEIVVVMAEPQNLQAIDELRFRTGKAISPRLGFRREIAPSIEKHYHGSVGTRKVEP